MTYRERRLARAAKYRGWAEKRTTEAHAALDADADLRHDWAFITQPGRIPARERMNRRDDRAFASLAKAESMERRAESIERAADRAIYSDDPDAVDRLRERIAELEAERERIRTYNASCRKAAKSGGAGDTGLLTFDQRKELMTLARVAAFQLRPGGGFPPYVLSNLGGNIGRLRERLATLEKETR